MSFEGTVFCKKFLKRWIMVLYIIIKAFSWIELILLFNFRLRNIQTTVAYENWDAMNVLRRSFLRSNFKEHAILAKAFSFWPAFLQRDLTWGLNVNLLAIWILRSFSHLLLEMAIPSMLIWIFCVEFVKWFDFSGFVFRRLTVKQPFA